MTLLLGIDEGTSAVKAVLYDGELRPVAEARREKPLSHPRPGWVEQDPDAVLAAVVEAVAEILERAPGEIDACGLDHQGESVLAWEADSGRPLTPIITWQDKRSQEILDRLAAAGREEEIRRRSGMPLDPYFSAGKIAWLLEHDDAVGAGARKPGTCGSVPSTRSSCDRLGAGFATDPSTASRTQLGAPDWDPELLEIFGVPRDVLPAILDTAGDLGTLRHPSWKAELPLRARCVDQQAALAGAGAVRPGLVKATYGTGVFVLAHAGADRPEPGGGLLPTIAWRVGGRVEWAIDGGVFTAGALLEWLSRDMGLAADPAALAAAAAGVDGCRWRAGAAGARRGRSAVVEVRGAGGDRRPDRRLQACARRARGARGDRVAGRGRGRCRPRERARRRAPRRRRADARSDAACAPGGLRRGHGAAGCGGRDRRRGGRAGCRGSGHLGLDARDRGSDPDRRYAWGRRRDEQWRAVAHAEWRAFVERAAAL